MAIDSIAMPPVNSPNAGSSVAAGSAIAGPIIDAHGSHRGFLVTIGAGAIAVVVTIVTMALRGRRAADRNEAAVAGVVE